eukprot:m.1024900 g.1024900  ORF g.1024900 m.1024900 type:complete len:928 (+) comp24101_c0_seq4:175-2958(+)
MGSASSTAGNRGRNSTRKVSSRKSIKKPSRKELQQATTPTQERNGSIKSRTGAAAADAPTDSVGNQKFRDMCQKIFSIADRNGDGKLDEDEFKRAFSSKTLSLNLSHNEMMRMMELADKNINGAIELREFTSLVRNLKAVLQKVYASTEMDINDWCYITDPKTGDMIYLNKRTGEQQRAKPKSFKNQRVEPLEFEYVTLADGTEISIHHDEDGTRKYMDWDTGQWETVPDDWLDVIDDTTDAAPMRSTRRQSIVGTTSLDGRASPTATPQAATDKPDGGDNGRAGVFEHPTKGLFHTFVFENTRNTRLFFDELEGKWVRMPLSWERNVEQVQTMLTEIDAVLPNWKNVNEQLLVLRECNYDVHDAIAFGEINFCPDEDEDDTAKDARATMRTTLNRSRARMSSVAPSASRLLLADDKSLALGTLSAPVAKYIRELEVELANAKHRVDAMEHSEREEFDEQVRQLERQVKLAEDAKARAERDLAAAEQRAADLSANLQKLSATGGASNTATVSASGLKALAAKIADIKGVKNELVAVKHEFKDYEANLTRAYAATDKLRESCDKHVSSITAKYRAEVIYRKQLYNKIQEMRGNIRVFLRCRPDNSGGLGVVKFPSTEEIIVPSLRGDDTMFDFDKTFDTKSTQEMIFADTMPTIMSVIDGYNVCIIAYGQTGSGKTHTMMGPDKDPGVNRRAIAHLLSLVEKEREVLDISLSVAMFEVYNENIFDLLADEGRTKRTLKSGPAGVYVSELTERVVTTPDEVEAAMALGESHRSKAATKMNTNSSRSHMLFQVLVDTYNKVSGVSTSARLSLVDLAGSERVARSEATGNTLVEAAAINKSLSALSQVFQSIATHATHIPYRNSKLTHVLQSSLGGDSKTCMFINIRPDRENLAETISTLNFGVNIRKIELGQASSHRSAGKKPGPPKSLH